MSEITLIILILSLLLAIYNMALLLTLRAKKASLLAQQDIITELLLRIRLGAVKRNGKL